MGKGRMGTVLLAMMLLIPNVSTASSDESERAAVLKTLESWNEGWRIRDAQLAVSDYAQDTDWTNAFGDRFQGRAALLEGLTFIFSLDFVMAGDSDGNDYQDVTFLADDIAMVRSRLIRKGQLTDAGEALRPVLMALTQWGDDWVSEGAAPPISFTHAKSRQSVRPAFVDEDGRETKMSEMRISLRR